MGRPMDLILYHPAAVALLPAVPPLLDDVASLPGVRAGVIAPDDPYFAYLRAIAAQGSSTDGGP